MSFVIFGDAFTFPDGSAATNRVFTYARGFYEIGINVHVICFENEYLAVNDGILNGVYYYHPFGQVEKNKHFLIRRWLKFKKYLRTIALIRKINKSDKIIAINCWTSLLFTQFFAIFLTKLVRTRLINEHSEHPLRNYQGSFFKKSRGEINSYLGNVLCDGIFCISQYLIDFYSSRGLNRRRLFLVPSTVDTERFRKSYESPLKFQYILYCGSLTVMKDGVNILIESFFRITEKYPEINLVLIGKGDLIDEETFIRNLVSELKIEKKVFFPGQLPRTEIPAYLNNAKILALARPKSMVADAGFPSKLTEYLATGVPVVVTEVGEIPLYLKDNENAFLAIPDSVDAFAEKLDYVLGNYAHALEVALRGKELTDSVFNYKYQAKRMLDFIYSLK
jgi:glycosyltransferase involved in cell wall biosynthesis